MKSIKSLKKELKTSLHKLNEGKFSKKLFDLHGFCYVKNVLSSKEIESYKSIWDQFYLSITNRKINKFNPAELLSEIPKDLLELSKNTKILKVIMQAVGGDVGLFRARIMLKDKNSRRSNPLHEDFCYQIGFQNKMSMFLALSNVDKKNGAMTYYSGTHKFGYLGDAGIINENLLDKDWPKFSVNLKPGDFVLMKSSTWHASGPNKSSNYRAITDFIYQPANDFSTKEILTGNGQLQKNFMNTDKNGKIISPYERTINISNSFFRESRATRLKKALKKIDKLSISVN